MVDPAETSEMQEINSKETVAKKVPRAKPLGVSPTDGFFPIDGIPSKYKLYPEGTKLHARPLKVLELKTLATLNENNVNLVINDVLSKAVKGLPIDDLIVADKLYLIFWLRAYTYKDSGYVIDFDCSECDTKSNYEFSLDCLNINDIKDNYDISKEIVLKKSGDTIKIGQLLIKDENNVQNFITKHRNSLMKFNEELLGIANLITEINGEELSMLLKYEYIVKLDPIDYLFIESYIKKYEIGIDPIMDVKCKTCGGTAPVAVTFRSEFFIPTVDVE